MRKTHNRTRRKFCDQKKKKTLATNSILNEEGDFQFLECQRVKGIFLKIAVSDTAAFLSHSQVFSLLESFLFHPIKYTTKNQQVPFSGVSTLTKGQ